MNDIKTKPTTAAIRLCDYYPELIRLRRWLHRHPELSMKEFETTDFILQYLQQLGISCRKAGETGVIGTLYAVPSPASDRNSIRTLAVRAEIDALPIPEHTGLSFCSEIPGQMHACGHDGITAVVLCLARVLSEHRDLLCCNVRFLFEPGEETGQGALHMISHGGLADPQVDDLLLFHYGNQENRGMEIQQSISTAAIGSVLITIKGKSSHWFQPECGHDALYAAGRLAVEIHNLNQTLADKTQYPFVLGFGLMNAGTAGNIVADSASLYGSLRAFTMNDYTFVQSKLQAVIDLIASETGTEILSEYQKFIPPIINDPILVQRGAAIGQRLMGSRFQLGTQPFLVGDNASYYLEHVPGMRTVFLAGKPDTPIYPIHNPRFDFDERVMQDALEFLFCMITEE